VFVTPLDTTVHVDEHRLRVQVRGAGRPLLLLNGVGAPLELWNPLLRRLTGVETIAIDTPGSGGSPNPALPLSIRGHAGLALRVLDSLGYGDVCVLGFSFGGLVAQEVARIAGRRVERIVLASTSCGWGGIPGSPEALLALTEPSRYYAGRNLGRPVRGLDSGPGSSETFRRGPHRSRGKPDAGRRGALYQFWAAATWSSLPWLWQLRQPALVLTGDRDCLVPPLNAHILTTLLPDARLHVVPNGDHLCLLNRAPEIAGGLSAFLAS
jgi:pimeloyl-ACP methyl ester carboxylesterase